MRTKKPDPIMKEVEKAREHRGESREITAGSIGVSLSTYYGWMRGVQPNRLAMGAIRAYLDKSPKK